MYKVYCDDNLIFHTLMEDRRIFSPKIDIALNKTGSFTFTIYPSNPFYNKLNKLKSIIKVYNDDFLIFRGRILDDDSYFHNQKQMVCEGELSFFLDTIQTDFSNITNTSELLHHLIDVHNSMVDVTKQFKVGRINIINDTIIDGNSKYMNTWDVINSELINKHGGYIFVRHEDDISYIDYLDDFDTLSNQPTIEFGKNLLDYVKKVKGSSITTAVIPLGKNKLTIGSVNNNVDYISDTDAVRKYGFICKTIEFNDVIDASQLKQLGQEYLDELKKLEVSLEINAIDMGNQSTDFNSFRLGTYIGVKSIPHDVDTKFLITKLSIDLTDPKSNKLVLGKTYSTFTEQSLTRNESQKQILNAIQGMQLDAATMDDVNNAIRLTEEVTSSNISQSADEIYAKVSQNFYLKDDADALVESINTEFIQTNEAFEMKFNQFSADIEDVANNTDVQFQEINKYIKFVDGSIILGQEGNHLTLKIENNEIGFYHKGSRVAYFSNNKLNVLDGEFIQSLKLGKFAFLPRTNKNLSFKKVEK